jgi:hypothetical protein
MGTRTMQPGWTYTVTVSIPRFRVGEHETQARRKTLRNAYLSQKCYNSVMKIALKCIGRGTQNRP